MRSWPTAGAVIGMALAARDRFFDGLTPDHTSASPMAHVEIADALGMIDEAQWHAGRPESHVDLAAVCRLATDAVYILSVISGQAAIRRIARDLEAAADRVLREYDSLRKADAS